MRAILLTLLALLAQAQAAALHTPAIMLRLSTDKENAKIANKSLEFVKIIREDLRRNNDDYAALMRLERQQRLLPPSPKGSPPDIGGAPFQTTPAPLTPGAPAREAGLGPLTRQPPQRTPSTRDPPIPQLPKYNARRGLDMTVNLTAPHPLYSTVFRSYVRTADKRIKKVRVDKLKRFIDRGKDRLREMARTSTTPQGGAWPNGLNAANGISGANGNNVANEAKGRKGKTEDAKADNVFGLNGIESLDEEPISAATPYRPNWRYDPPLTAAAHHTMAHRNYNQQGSPFQLSSPSPDQLDMAPARGPKVQLGRYKGRLCQRNAMLIEGPRYNSKGSTVRPPWDEALDGPFRIKMPDIILPRCCNCCKKSVLGCQ